ncbi:Pyrroline-5-carboxylate reductase [uncultured Sporomusa sp.]|nr:pyrroline-5-carboxylate reductase [uncultured Sporomusa sp.]SCM83822.1 Pyrroline-5-carboxylate reductase [uncultured Sporomusa sp.]
MSTIVGCIGAGNIVKALLAGVEKSGVYFPNRIGIFDVSQKVCDDFREKGYTVFSSIDDLVKSARVVVVAVTPQVIDSIMQQIKNALSADTIFLSLAAGVSIKWYQEQLGKDCKVIRCMPTLTAQVGLGAFAVSRAETVADDDYKAVECFLSSCGIVEEIPESLMCEVVPINGSAPAYFYHMTRVILKEAVHMGFDEDTALRLFAQTMKGSAEMLLNSGMSAEMLEDKLRLKGGTTLAALDKMDELGFDRCLTEGIKACVSRCKELGNL